MPRKSKNQVEEQDEVEVKAEPKKLSFAVRWFNEYAVNDRHDLKIICDLTARSMHDQFQINVATDNTEIYGVIFYVTFMEILKFIRSKQKDKYKKQFNIEIANSLNIGYINNTDDSNEKVGNFMPIMEYISVNRNVVPPESDRDTKHLDPNLIRWKEMNSKQNAECYKSIQDNTFKTLADDYGIMLRTAEMVIPCFCIFLDNTTNYLKLKFQDESTGNDISEVSIDVFGLYKVFYSYDEDEDGKTDDNGNSLGERIEYVPSIPVKLALKQDELAAGD